MAFCQSLEAYNEAFEDFYASLDKLEKRLSDQLHLDLKKTLNHELYNMNIRVINLNETNFRKKLANIYYTINSVLPF